MPLYPGARGGGAIGNESRILDVLNRLRMTEPLTRVRTFTMGGRDWVGNSLTPEDVFRFSLRRMQPVQIWRMGSDLRSILGLRPGGEVDSPPLLYVGDRSAVLVRSLSKGDLGLLVAVSCSRTL